MRTITEERIRVRYGETDQMGHAYYANYLFWFEQARGAWCRDRGFTYKSLETEGILLPVVEVGVRYRGEVKYDDLITIRVWVSETSRAAMRFEYEVVSEAGQILTTGFSWHVTMSAVTRRAMSIPPYLQEMIARNPDDFESLTS